MHVSSPRPVPSPRSVRVHTVHGLPQDGTRRIFGLRGARRVGNLDLRAASTAGGGEGSQVGAGATTKEVRTVPGLPLKEARVGVDGLDWARNSIAYQIFPDRFAPHPNPEQHGLQFAPWGSTPTLRDFQGGHLLGVVDKLDYLQDMSVDLLYFTPVITSSAYHRYHPSSFTAVDPLLGGEKAMRTLLKECGQRGMHVVVDGVFNHTGRGHDAFVSLMENGPASPYTDWYTVHEWPVEAYEHERGDAHFDCWWDIPELPELNYSNPGVRAHILDVASQWLDMGCAGWRLDAPTRVPMDFWEQFRETCKATRPGSYLVGEVFGLEPSWVGDRCFDGLMNYTFGSLSMGFFGQTDMQQDEAIGGDYYIQKINAEQFGRGIDRMHIAYMGVTGSAPQFLHLNLFDSHDTARALWMLKGNTTALQQVILFQMVMPGIPMIYNGDEVGLVGGRDPENRWVPTECINPLATGRDGPWAAFPWHTPESWDIGLLTFYRKATALRRAHRVLRVGGFQQVPIMASSGAEPSKLFAFIRWISALEDNPNEGALALVVFNADSVSASDMQINLNQCAVGGLDNDVVLKDAWSDGTGDSVALSDGAVQGVTVPAHSAVVLVAEGLAGVRAAA